MPIVSLAVDPKPVRTPKLRTTHPTRPQWSLARILLAISLVALIPTGIHGNFGFWFVAETAGIGYLLSRIHPAHRAKAPRKSLPVTPLPVTPLTVWLLASASLCGLQLLMGVSPSGFETLRIFHLWFGAILLIPLTLDALSGFAFDRLPTGPTVAVVAMLFAALAAGTVSSYRPLASGGDVWWPFVYRNHYAAFAVLLVPVLLWSALSSVTGRWLSLSGVVAAIAGVASSGSRSGLIAMAVTLLIFFALAARTSMRRLGLLAIALSVLAAGLAFTNWTALSYRLREAGPLLDGRVDYWTASVEMIRARPLLGWGFGMWPDVYPQFCARDAGMLVNHAHSDWLEFAAEGGLAVLPLLVVLLVRACRLAIAYPWLTGAPVVLLLAMVDYPLRLPLVLAVFVVLVSAAEAAARAKICEVATSPAIDPELSVHSPVHSP